MEDIFDLDLSTSSNKRRGGGGIVLIILFVIVMGIIAISMMTKHITSDSTADFRQAKIEGKEITCNGLINTYTVETDKYTVYDEHIKIKTLLWSKTFKTSKCHIEN